MAIPFLYACTAALVLLFTYLYMRSYNFRRKLRWVEAAPGYPLIGNAFDFADSTKSLTAMYNYLLKHNGVCYVELLGKPAILISDYKFVEWLLSSSTLTTKSDDYKYLHNWLEGGMIISSGPLWKKSRKILTPAFHFAILEKMVDVFEDPTSVLIKMLSKQVGKDEVDVYPYITRFTLDVICQTSMGVQLNIQEEANEDYFNAIAGMSKIIVERVFNPFKTSNFLYRLSSDYVKEQNYVKLIHEMSDNIIEKRKKEIADERDQEEDNEIGAKRKLAFLDLLLKYRDEDGQPLSHSFIRREVNTFLFAGHDTTASAISFALYCLANHPDEQVKALIEVKEVLGDRRKITFKDLQEMKYLELVVKEVLRLYPSVPYHARLATEDFAYNDGNIIPKGVTIYISLYTVNRDPSVYENPEEFNPSRFLDTTIKPFSYIPFSAGPRNCIGVRNVDDLLAVAVYARDRVNPYLFNYALSVALLHRADTQDLDVPSIIHAFPDKYLDSKVFSKAREDANVVPVGARMPIEIPKDYTASDLEEEHRLAYFRQDIGLNLHHWHWHLVYPFEGPMAVVNKNRRGELFYYMHEQIMARYNFERLCNKMKRAERYLDWDGPIKEAYFPKLDSLVASRSWPARVGGQKLQNLRREVDAIMLDVDDMKRWRDRIYNAIHSGVVTDRQGKQIQLTEFEGIDVLGNMVESSILSPNREFYGDLHNTGHVMLSFIHDPDHRHLESFGVIGDSATAMRDPIFYRWHGFIDDLFQEFKSTLPRYTENQLNNPGVTVQSIEVDSAGGQPNILQTFWQQSDVDLSRGMDFQPRGAVFVRFTHLQHRPFTYKIQVQSNQARQGTCRIFMAPKFDERGNPWLFRDQRLMFIELDKFKVNLKQGKNTITRSSADSSVTIPFERTYRDLDTARPEGGEQLAQFNFCGCGWPDNLLIPKGSPEGFTCQLFVMISNIADDMVNQDTSGQCNDADSYCGIKDKLYPDRRSMGYPFDRMPRNGVDMLQDFLTPNMRVQDVSIQFQNKTFKPRELGN